MSPQLPKKYEIPKHQKEELFNNVVDFLEERCLSFKGADEAKTCGRPFIEKLTNVLWDIDNHHEKLNSFAKRKHELKPIPTPLSKFTGFNDLVKKKSTRLNREILKKHGDAIFELLIESWLERREWKDLHQMLLELANLVVAYAKDLEEHCAKQQEVHSRTENIHKWEVRDTEASQFPVRPEYTAVNRILKGMKEYEILELNAEFLPENRQQRYLFLKKLQLGVPFQMFKCLRGSSNRNMVFVWKLTLDAKQRSTSSSLEAIKHIEQLVPEKHSRKMRREFRILLKLHRISLMIFTSFSREILAAYQINRFVSAFTT